MKEFIFSNWKEIVIFVFTFACFLVSLFKKKGKVDPAKEKVISYLPHFIRDAESSIKGAKEKKNFVLTSCINLYKVLTGVNITYDSYVAKEFSDAIEDILDTPQKKGD